MQRGFATLEIIFALIVIAVLMTVALPNVKRIIDRAALDYETKSLYSELRFLQSLNRSGKIDAAGSGRKFKSEAPSLQISPSKFTWQILRGKTPIGDAHQMHHIKKIELNFETELSQNKITFDTNGQATNIAYSSLSGKLTLTSRLGKNSKIVFDSVGRFRGGRDNE